MAVAVLHHHVVDLGALLRSVLAVLVRAAQAAFFLMLAVMPHD